MRKSPLLDAILPRTRQKILSATLLHPDRWWYMTELAKHLDVTPSSLQLELTKLTAAGILELRSDGNRTYYRGNTNCPVLSDLQGLLVKTVGVIALLAQALKPYSKSIVTALVFGSFADSRELVTSDIDLMVIGSVGLADLSQALRRVESQIDRPINPVILSTKEARQKLDSGHHLLETVRKSNKLFLLGQDSELGKTLS